MAFVRFEGVMAHGVAAG